jgi:CRISPR-associated protein (TIGR03986 family)
MSIPSPYNFVPLSERVFFPDWGERISQDVPFSDGISGVIDVTVTATTPIYIRGGGEHPEGDARLQNAAYTDFFRVTQGGPYAIPGSSFKGMLRNVVEIASFGKIVGTKGDTGRVVDHRYAIRDLHNGPAYTKHITEDLGKKTYKPKVRAAWLREGAGNTWILRLCNMARVEQEDLEKLFALRGKGLGERQSAQDKYALCGMRSSTGELIEVWFTCGGEQEHTHSGGLRLCYRKATELKKNGEPGKKTKGVLVLTGQPAPRKERGCTDRNGRPCSRGKHMEFLFFDLPSAREFPVPAKVKEEFQFIHSTLGENRQANEEWGFWKPRLEQGEEIPVFVLFEEDGKTIRALGLALMFRLPYKRSIHQAIERTSPSHLDGTRLDFAEGLFGRVEDKDGLRGRVSVEPLLAEGTPQLLQRVVTVLGAPKPTYYPNYLEQPGGETGRLSGETYKTFMDSDAKIRGWKRYWVRPDGSSPNPPQSPTDSVATAFCPLAAGTVFSGRMHLHNVRPQELGAIFWALTWGGEEKLRHGLGMAKPYGYGSVRVTVTGCDLRWCDPKKGIFAKEPGEAAPKGGISREKLQEWMRPFTEMMENWFPKEGKRETWSDSPQIRALKAMADPEKARNCDLRYPRLDSKQRVNEFVDCKKECLVLAGPLAAGGRQGGASAAPLGGSRNATAPQGGGGRRSTSHTAPAEIRQVPPPRLEPRRDKQEQNPFGQLLNEFNRLGLKEFPKRTKELGIDPQSLSPDQRQQISQRLQKKFGGNFAAEELLKAWKP